MFYHIIMTPACNLQCRYCFGKTCDDFICDNNQEYDESIPLDITYEIETLKKFIQKDNNPTLTFYGGEPLLKIKKIKEIMDNIEARYMMQTNGILLNQLPQNYINNFHTILVSIDGDQTLTNLNRGKGTYEKVMNNIKSLNFNGELIARMTVDEETDIYKAVTHLVEQGFNSIHWQIDAMFWKNDYKDRNFKEWSLEYNKQITKLIQFWISKIEEGKIIRLYPFLDITEDLLLKRKTKLRCGSGWINFTIATNGNIVPCPIMSTMKKYYLGNIKTTNPNEIKHIEVKEPCTSCDYLEKCGGRCLYANLTQLWPEKGYNEVCNTIKHLIDELEKQLPKIQQLIDNKIISLEDFNHVKYNGSEVIP